MKQKPGSKWLWILIVLGIALAVRMRAVNILPIDIDEPKYLNVGLGYTRLIREGDIKGVAWYDENAEHPVLTKMLYGVSFFPLPPIDRIYQKDLVYRAAVQTSEARGWIIWGRYLTMIFGVLAAAVLAWMNPVAGLLLALQTSAVRYSSQIGLEAMPALTALLCVLAYEHWISRQVEKFTREGWGWLAFSAIMLGLTASSKYVYCLVGLVIMFHLLWQTWHKKWQFKQMVQVLLLWGALSVLTFFVTDPYLWPRPISRLIESVSYHFSFASSEYVAKYAYPFWQPLVYLSRTAGKDAWYWIRIDGIIMFLAFFGVYPLRKKPLYLMWFIVSLLFLLIWKTKWPQYVMVMMVPYCLSAGEAVKMLWGLGKTRISKQQIEK